MYIRAICSQQRRPREQAHIRSEYGSTASVCNGFEMYISCTQRNAHGYISYARKNKYNISLECNYARPRSHEIFGMLMKCEDYINILLRCAVPKMIMLTCVYESFDNNNIYEYLQARAVSSSIMLRYLLRLRR